MNENELQLADQVLSQPIRRSRFSAIAVLEDDDEDLLVPRSPLSSSRRTPTTETRGPNSMRDRIAQLSSRVSRLQNENAQLENERETLRDQISHERDQVYADRLSQAEQDAALKAASAAQIFEHYVTVRDELAAVRASLLETQKSLESERVARVRAEAAAAAAAAAGAAANDAQLRITTLESEIANLRASLQISEAASSAARTFADETNVKLQHQAQRAAAAEAAAAAAEKRVLEVEWAAQQKPAQVSEDVVALQLSEANLRAKVAELERARDAAESNTPKLFEVIEGLEQRISLMSSTSVDLEQINQLKQSILSLLVQCAARQRVEEALALDVFESIGQALIEAAM